ncbi:MAG: Tyrosine recombinase XerC [Phycisphaerae bacterium]|nr:Tyrosine recombinase XerC [Phycisphaerae bacterium]
MATVFRKTYTQHLPKGAKIVQRQGKKMALWLDAKGRPHYDDVTVGRKGKLKIIRHSPTWTAQYRDADGNTVFEGTGCRDEQAARHVLAKLVQRVEHIKAGIITPQQYRMADHADRPLAEHVEDYLEHLKAKTVRGRRVSAKHRENVKRELTRVVGDCRFRRLGDITRDAMERWMNAREEDGMGARTRNTYRSSIVAFCNWCVETDRMATSPLAKLCVADERGDRRRARRALTQDEVARLLTAARLRPLAEFGRETIHRPAKDRKGRRTWTKAPLVFDDLEAAAARARAVLKDNPEFLEELERVGRERALAYRIMVLTGLRKGELASLTAGQLELDAPSPFAELLAKDEKAGRGAKIPLRADLVAEIREHLADKLGCLQTDARRGGQPVPVRLPAATRLLRVPRDFVRILDRDLAVAGIAKTDDRGRRVDIHALRHTFGTHLSLAGVAPRVAQAAMRHSTLELTMNVYTDPQLLDVAGAIDSLPAFSRALTHTRSARIAPTRA